MVFFFFLIINEEFVICNLLVYSSELDRFFALLQRLHTHENLCFSAGEFQNRKQSEEEKRKTCLSFSPSSPERELYAMSGKLLIFTRSSRKTKSLRLIYLLLSVGLSLLLFSSPFSPFRLSVFFSYGYCLFRGKSEWKGQGRSDRNNVENGFN